MNEYYGNNDWRDYSLQHHGIENQQWGVRNGPPYPLDPKISAAVKAGSWKKVLSKEERNTQRERLNRSVEIARLNKQSDKYVTKATKQKRPDKQQKYLAKSGDIAKITGKKMADLTDDELRYGELTFDACERMSRAITIGQALAGIPGNLVAGAIFRSTDEGWKESKDLEEKIYQDLADKKQRTEQKDKSSDDPLDAVYDRFDGKFGNGTKEETIKGMRESGLEEAIRSGNANDISKAAKNAAMANARDYGRYNIDFLEDVQNKTWASGESYDRDRMLREYQKFLDDPDNYRSTLDHKEDY